MATDPISGGGSSTPVAAGTGNALREVNIDDFLKLMIAELQNQDPLNPMDNSQILEQISQIHSVESTKKLSSTLDSVLLGQNLSSASSMIDKTIQGLADGGSEVTGVVESVSIQGGVSKLKVGDKTVSLNNVRAIISST